MATPRIFISYRREDASGHAGRLFDRLVERFGREHVFRDFETIAAGDDFAEALRRKIAVSDVVLVLIGPRWLAATDEAGQWRLADDSDRVRIEIDTALEHNVRVIPVLVQGAAMPRAKDLPAALARLAQRNAIEIRDPSFDPDLRALLDQLDPTWPRKLSRVLRRRPVYAAATVLVAGLTAPWIYSHVISPERARISLAQMGVRYDEETFIRSAAKNDLQAVRLFLAAGMPANTPTGGEALAKAAAGLHLEMVQLLFERGARDDRALGEAVAAPGKRGVFDYLLAHEPGNAALGAAVRVAAGSPYTDLLHQLIEHGADVNVRSSGESPFPYTALHAAAGAWRLDHVLLLLARGAAVDAANREGETALHAAIDARSSRDATDERELIPILQALVQKGADVNLRWHNMETWQPTPLLLAIRQRLQLAALWLLEHGAQPNVWAVDTGAGTAGPNALIAAAGAGLADLVQALVAEGVPVDLCDEAGDTALIAAFNTGRADPATVQALLAAGADVNARDGQGRSALMWATRGSRSMEVIGLLLAARPAVNVTDRNGWSALMYAAQAGYFAAARDLLAAGADPSLKNDAGQDALALAQQAKSAETVKLLSERATARGRQHSSRAVLLPRGGSRALGSSFDPAVTLRPIRGRWRARPPA